MHTNACMISFIMYTIVFIVLKNNEHELIIAFLSHENDSISLSRHHTLWS